MRIGCCPNSGMGSLALSRTALLVALACLAGPIPAAPALAQGLVDTQQGADPRRSGSAAANVTVETNPQGDVEGIRDPERVEESYQPKGIEAGRFLLLPLVEFEQRYNSNLYATATNQHHDFITRVAPEIQARSRFTEHEVNMLVRLESIFHRRFDGDDQTNGVFNLNGRYDIARDWEANGTLNLRRQHEDRGSPDDAGGEQPTPADGASVQIGSKLTSGRYSFQGSLQAERLLFGNVDTSSGRKVHNADRNRNELEATGRVSYEIVPGYFAVGAVQANTRRYDQEFDDEGFQRSSYGGRVETGIGVDLTQLIRGDFLVGYLRQDYEDPRLNDPQGPTLRAVLNWTPSRLTVVVPALERGVQETTTRNASAIVRSSASLLVRHEYARNIVLTGYAAVTESTFEGIDRNDYLYEGRGRVIWALAPEYYIGGELGYRKRVSNADGAGYDQLVVGLRAGLRM